MRTCACLSLTLLGSAFLAGPASANPTGLQVVSGTATMQQSGNLLQITNSPNAILNWQSFSISANEITRFLQQSSSSAVLNRVIAQNPSSILGALQSNGRVFVINPSGILFGAGAQVDVAGLVASTLNLSDADFLAGRLRFPETLNAGAVVNQGAITAGAGGVYLIGASVTNGGVISNPQGEVVLAAGRSVELVDPGTAGLRVEINAPDNEALNLGQIIASSGRIGIFAGLVRSSGTLNADRAVAGPAGEIVLKATTIVIEGPGSVSAVGGTIKIEGAGGVTVNSPIGGGDVIVIAPGNVSAGQGVLLGAPSGSITLQTGAQSGVSGSISVSTPVTTTSGNVSLTGRAIPPASVATSGSGSVALNAGNVTLNAAGGATAQAARALQLGVGQVVGSLSSTSQINDSARLLDGSAARLLAPRSSSLISE